MNQRKIKSVTEEIKELKIENDDLKLQQLKTEVYLHYLTGTITTIFAHTGTSFIFIIY